MNIEERRKRIEAEAETYRMMHEDAKELGYPSILEALEDLERLKPLQDEMERLREALRPFAEKADRTDKHIKLWSRQWHDGTTMSVKLGDLRKARAALSQPQGSSNGD